MKMTISKKRAIEILIEWLEFIKEFDPNYQEVKDDFFPDIEKIKNGEITDFSYIIENAVRDGMNIPEKKFLEGDEDFFTD